MLNNHILGAKPTQVCRAACPILPLMPPTGLQRYRIDRGVSMTGRDFSKLHRDDIER
jgi:hypothetical protein